MVERRTDRKTVMNIKIKPGVECVQQHRLVITDLNIGWVYKGKEKACTQSEAQKANDC